MGRTCSGGGGPRRGPLVAALATALGWLLVGLAPVHAGAGGSDDGLDPTGREDSTAALQRRIDGTPDGGVVALPPDAVLRVEGTIVVRDRRDLRIEGNGARLVARDRGAIDRAHVRIVGGRGVVVRDLRIEGANPYAGLADAAYQEDLVGQHGVRLEGAAEVELDRIAVSDVFGDFVYIGPDDEGRWSERVWIHDSAFVRSGRQGITVTAGGDVLVQDNEITLTRRASIDLEPNGQRGGARNVHVLDNRIGPGRLLFVAAAGRGPVDDVVVARNRLVGHILNITVTPPGSDRRRNFWVVDNTSDTDATEPPMRFTRVDGIVVTGNRQPMVRDGRPAVEPTASCSILVEDNRLDPGDLALPPGLAPCGPPPRSDPPAPPSFESTDRAGSPTSSSTPPTTRAGDDELADAADDDGDQGVGAPTLVAVGATVVIVLAVLADLGWRARRTRRRSEEPWRRR